MTVYWGFCSKYLHSININQCKKQQHWARVKKLVNFNVLKMIHTHFFLSLAHLEHYHSTNTICLVMLTQQHLQRLTIFVEAVFSCKFALNTQDKIRVRKWPSAFQVFPPRLLYFFAASMVFSGDRVTMSIQNTQNKIKPEISVWQWSKGHYV